MKEQVLTVKEYADFYGISTTAVYKRIKTNKLNLVEMVINGKKVKCIKISDEQQKADIEPTNQTTFETVSNVELAAIIKEKDEIIKSKNVEIARLRSKEEELERLWSKNEELIQIITKQNNELTELLKQSNVLLQNSQILLKGHKVEVIEETTATATAEPQKVRKKHFWNRKKD